MDHIDKLTNRECMDEKLQRLQLLLLRGRTVIEEADGRRITNSGMLMQLKLLSERMYRGYYVLGSFKYWPIIRESAAEQQKENFNNQGGPAILPIIGGHKVGKRTLVSHVCSNEKIRSHFSSILHISEHVISRIEHEKFPYVNDEDWMNFYSCVSRMGEGTKVIIISRLEELARLATVKPLYLKLLSQDGFSYIFKVLAFGSTNPEDYPQLLSIGNELAALMDRSWIIGNVLADVLRKNLNTQFWFHVLKRYKRTLENNMMLFGDHSRSICWKDRPIDITKLIYYPAPFRTLPPHIAGDVPATTQLSRVTFGDLIVGSASPPKEMLELRTWESRLPPYSKILHICVEDKAQSTALVQKGFCWRLSFWVLAVGTGRCQH
ncbi:uncharacterized protein C2845_PM03G31040 [Panicum miliaceum]|uniref:NB-ARC domain-containing protein n=1 Tax=Panicum miliaceum TaxID=4540 RepID=A0A3L6TED7_PANMI|nr:uncharacterized protein C2845_PM03G31040 [Panicum miliaceum]